MSEAPAEHSGRDLTAHGALPSDADRGVVRIDPADMRALGLQTGDIAQLNARRATHARVLPTPTRFRGQGVVMLDGLQRDNAGAAIGEAVRLSAADAGPARALTLTLEAPANARRTPPAPDAALIRKLKESWTDMPVTPGDRLRIRLLGGRALTAVVSGASPDGPVLIGPDTRLTFEAPAGASSAQARAQNTSHAVTYEDLGGLSRELAKVREMIELPLRRPDLFEHLGVEAPKGVLLTGPPGSGKTLLARAVAAESQAAFFQINGPEIVARHYGESEGQLRAVFEKAAAQAPAIVFIDEIDAIAPHRDRLAGDRQVERRIVAQLLTLLDGLSDRGQLIVMAATNLPDSLDAALRRPGRFDREINFSAPDRAGRREILDVHTRGMPLSSDVDLSAIAADAHGFVGADLAALAREAAMAALRRVRAWEDGARAERLALDDVQVTRADFDTARRDVAPSALREVFTEIPDVGWEDVGGLDTLKRQLEEAVLQPLRYPEAYARLGLAATKGVLLAGPPGSGKTHMAKALASRAQVNFITVRASQLLSPYVGEAEQQVARVFAKARQAGPCLIFFDEIDALAPRRHGGSDAVSDRVVAQLLTEIDGVDELRGVVLLGATNRPEAVDPALLRPGRFDLLVETPQPDTAARRAILTIHTRRTPLADDVDLAAVAEATDGYWGADLAELCREAARTALRRANGVGAEALAALQITAADFTAARAARAASDRLRPTSLSARNGASDRPSSAGATLFEESFP